MLASSLLTVWTATTAHGSLCNAQVERSTCAGAAPVRAGNFFFAGARTFFRSLESAVFLFRCAEATEQQCTQGLLSVLLAPIYGYINVDNVRVVPVCAASSSISAH
jgi:hypothetical protein